MAQASRVVHIPLDAPIDAATADHVRGAIARRFGSSDVTVGADSIAVHLRADAPAPPSADTLEDLVVRLLEVPGSQARDVVAEVKGPPGRPGDPHPVLAGSGDMAPIAEGLYGYAGSFLAVMRGLDGLLASLAQAYGALPAAYPPLWSARMFQATKAFSPGHPRPILCTPVQADDRTRRSIAQTMGSADTGDEVPVAEHFDPARYGLPPMTCQCAHHVLALAGDARDHAVTAHTVGFRPVEALSDGIAGAGVFSVRSIMASGQEAFVLAARETWLDDMASLLEFLDLGGRIEAEAEGDAASRPTMGNTFSETAGLRYAVKLRLPYAETETTAGAVTVHLESLTRALDPEGEAPRPFNGCLTVELERFALALFAQYGADDRAWPDHLRQTLGLDAGGDDADTIARRIWGGPAPR